MLAFVFVNLPELARLQSSSGFIGNIQTLAVWGAGLFTGVLAVFLLAAMFPVQADRILVRTTGRLMPARFQESFLGVARRFLSGLAALRSPKDAVMIFFTSVLIWLLETGKYWFVMHAFPSSSFFTLVDERSSTWRHHPFGARLYRHSMRPALPC
jgi:hypothetical protein